MSVASVHNILSGLVLTDAIRDSKISTYKLSQIWDDD